MESNPITNLRIEGFDIRFPFQPYEQQLNIMSGVLRAAKKPGSVAAIESPTGTGKTLSLLASRIGFLERNEGVKVFYLTRTIHQIDNILREMKKLRSVPEYSVLASRDFMCLNKRLVDKTGKKKADECKKLVRDRGCPFILKRKLGKEKGFEEPCDIEELRTFSENQEKCLYYKAKDSVKQSRLIITTYSYLLRDGLRRSNDINLKDNIVIFDEGHNLEDNCEDSASVTIQGVNIEEARKEVLGLLKKEKAIGLNDPSIGKMISIYENLLDFMLKLTEKGKKDRVFSYPDFNKVFFEFFDQKELLLSIAKFTDVSERLDFQVKQSFSELILSLFSKVLKMNKDLKRSQSENAKGNEYTFKHYFVSVTGENEDSIKLELLCMNPIVKFKELQESNFRTFIIASGTLYPVSTLETQLGIKFDIKVQNSHVVPKESFFFLLVGSYKGYDFNFNYTNRSDEVMKGNLVSLICELSEPVKGNVIVYFSSHSYLEEIAKFLEKHKSLKKMLEEKKTLYFDKSAKIDSKTVIQDFMQSSEGIKSGILFTVMRSSSSEGFNFTDNKCRLAIVVGIPYCPQTITKVKLKKNYLSDKYGTRMWHQWYDRDAMKITNQALGRVIRHQKDFGGMVVVDKRFEGKTKFFCKWLGIHSKKSPSQVVSKFFTKVIETEIDEEFLEELLEEELDTEEQLLTKKKVSY